MLGGKKAKIQKNRYGDGEKDPEGRPDQALNGIGEEGRESDGVKQRQWFKRPKAGRAMGVWWREKGREEGAQRGNCRAGARALGAARLPGEMADTLRRCYSGVGDDDKYDNLYKI